MRPHEAFARSEPGVIGSRLLLAAGLLLAGSAFAACSGDEPEAGVLRTPDERFTGLPDFDFEPHYLEIEGLRIHYLDEGPADAETVLLLHGEPSWSYLYRHMIPPLVAGGKRAIAPDLIGFGRSDKPTRPEAYSYQGQVDMIAELLERLDLRALTLFGQDWGGLVGLRVAAAHPQRFARIVASNTGLPAGGRSIPLPFRLWRAFSRWSPVFPIGRIVDQGSARELSAAERAAYDAPFPDKAYTAGARIMPSLVPIADGMPGVAENRAAWRVFEGWDKPFLTAFGDSDPITRGAEVAFIERIPGARGQPHVTLAGARHFIQEDRPEELAALILDFIDRTPLPGAEPAGAEPEPRKD